MNNKIKIIDCTAMNFIVERHNPCGLYITLEEDDSGTFRIVACYNPCCEAYVAEFHDLASAVNWLHGEEADTSDKIPVSADKVREALFTISEMERIADGEYTPLLIREANRKTAEIMRNLLHLLGLNSSASAQNQK